MDVPRDKHGIIKAGVVFFSSDEVAAASPTSRENIEEENQRLRKELDEEKEKRYKLEKLVSYGGFAGIRECLNCYKPYPDFSASSHLKCWSCRDKVVQEKLKSKIAELEAVLSASEARREVFQSEVKRLIEAQKLYAAGN